jgi:hypothetical protein
MNSHNIYLIRFLPLFLILVLTGCKVNLDGDVYIGDIIDVAETQEQLFNPMDISFEMSSVSACEDDKEKLSIILDKYFTNFNAKECYSEDFNAFLKTGFDIPVILDLEKNGEFENSQSDLISLTIVSVKMDTGYRYDVYLVLNRILFNSLNAEIYDEFFQKIELDDAKIKLSINNDGRETEKISFASAFVNGEPAVFYSTYDLERRQKLDYIGSDVTRASFDKYGHAYIMSVNKF